MDLFQAFGVNPRAAPAKAPPGRDLLEEFGAALDTASSRAESSPAAGRDLFQELGVEVEAGMLDKVKSAAASAGRFVAGAVKQTGQDIAGLVGSQPSVMKDQGRDLLAEFGLADASASRADPRDVAVAQRVLQGVVDENRRRDIGTLKPDDRVIDAPFRKPLAPVRPEGVLPRVAKDVASGVTGLGAGFAGAAEWMTGAPSTAAAAKYLEAVTQNLTPDDPNFGDQLAAGAGSFAGFFLPGLGVAKGAQAIGKVNTVLANWLGAGASAGLEAAAEAGSVYRELRQQGKSAEEASHAATGVFWSNAALVGATNKLGLFSEAGGAVRRGATAAATEGFQEGSQQAISNVATGRPVSEGVGTSAAIGTILGGGAGTVMGARSRPAPAVGISDADIIDQRTAAPAQTPVTGTTPGEPSAAVPIGQPAAPGPVMTSQPAEAPVSDLFEQLGVTPPTAGQGPVGESPVSASEAGAAGAPAVVQPVKRPFDMTVAELEAAITQKQLSDREALMRALGAERAREFERLDRARNSADPERADKAAREFDQKFGNLTQGQERLIYGIGDTDAQVEDLKTLLAARSDLSGEPLSEVGRVLTRGMLDATPAEMREFMRTGSGSFRVQAAAARVQNAVNAFNVTGASREQIDAAIGGAMTARGYSYDDALEVLAPFTRKAPEAPTARGNAVAGNRPRAIAQAPDSAQPRSAGSASETGNTAPIAASRTQDAGIDFTRIRGGQPLLNPRDGYAVSATGLPEGQYLVSPAGANVGKDRAAWPFQPFVTDENGVRAFASRSRPAPAPSSTTPAETAPRAALGSPPLEPGSQDMAATAVGRRTYTPPATATEQVDVDQARPDQIREAIRKLFNVPINERGVTVRRAAGIYKVKPQTIRVRNQNDVDVIAHEVGHHFSETKPRVRGLMKQHEGELLAITPDAYAKEPKALRREEGFAEFVRLYLTQQSEAKRLAPGFMKEFDAFINDNPHYRAAFDQVRGMVDQWFTLDPAERIMAKVGGRPKSLTERLSETFGKDRLIFEALDNWHPLKLMVADLKPGIAASVDPFKAAHLLSGDAAVIEDWLVSGTIPFDPVKRADPANYGKPLHDILKPVAKDLRRFSAYLIAKRAQELKARGKENLLTHEEIGAGLTLETPEFKAAAEEVYKFNDQLLDYAVEGGLLSEAAAAKFREYTAYIPFFRETEDGAGGAARGSVFHRLRGGTENLRDPISNLIQNTANIVHATNRNAVLAKAYQLAQSVPGGGRWIESIPMPKKAVQVTTERIIEQLKKEGVAIDTTMAEDLAAIQTFFQPNTLGDDRHRITVAKIEGEPRALQVNNKMLWQALQAFEPLDLGIVGSMLAVPSDLLRAGVTLSPEFMARNFMRDTLSGFIQSKRRLIPLVNTIGGFKEVATRSDAYKLYRAFGGAYGDLWKGESEQTRKILERMAKRGKFDPRTILTPSGIIDVLHRLGSVSEAGTRVAEFKKTAKAGDVDSLIDAAYNAREVSVDFGMHGHNKAVRMLTRITPFLNPAMQGFYKMGRTSREQFFTTLLRGSVLAAFSVALFLMNRDEDWYDDIENWERDVYWHIDVGLSENGKVIPLRIPKPFEWGAIFGSIPEALTQVATDFKGSKFAKRLQSIFENVFALRTVPTAVLVPAELWANKNTFTDRPIVPESKERLDPDLQFTPGTSLTAREVGKATGTSPAQIDHAVRGFLGTMGVYSVMLSDQALRLAGDYPEPPTSSWRQMPVVKAFVRDPDNPNSRHVNEFYELLTKARRAEASHKKYEGEAADAYYAKHKAAIDLAKDANRAARDIGDLRRDSEDITGSRDYTGREKRRLINENSAMIREIAKGITVEAPR